MRVIKFTAQQEWEWEDYFEEYPVAVNGYVYQRGVWRDPVAQTSKKRVHSRWGVKVDEEKVRKEERERMERNEVTEFSFLIEEDRRAEAERVERRVQAETRRAMGALQEAESKGEVFRTIVQVRILTAVTICRILSADERVRYISVDGSDEDEFRTASFKTETEEASLRARLNLKEEKVVVLMRRKLWEEGFPLRDDSVTLVVPLSNEVHMTSEGRAMLRQHPHNQAFFEYPRRLDLRAMGENRAKVLQEISTAADLRNMEATEQEDVVAVSARFFHDDQGEALGNVFGALCEIADVCHGARTNNHNATERRRRAIEAKAEACTTSANADSRESPTGEQEAVDAAGGGRSGGEEDEGEGVGGGDTEEKMSEEELLGPNCPMLVLPSEEGGLRVNPRLEISPFQHEYLSQLGIAVDESGKLLWKGEEDGGNKDITNEGNVADLTTDDDQNSRTTRMTRDKGDSQDKNHTSKSGRGEE